MKMCLGAQLYTVRDYMKTEADYRQTMKKLSDIGYKTLDMSGYNNEIITPELIRDVTRENNLEVVLTHTPPKRFLGELDRVLEEHDLFGCNAIGIGGYYELERDYDGFMRFCDEFAPIIEKIKAAGKVFLYHNHRFEFEKWQTPTGEYKSGLELVMENTDPTACKLTFDAYWAVAAGVDAADFIRRYGDRIFCTHFKDMAVKNDEVVMTELLTGNMNYDAIMASCADAGIRHLFVEQDNVYMDAIESMKISHDNMKARYDLD